MRNDPGDRHTSGRREGDSHGYENFLHDNGVEAAAQGRGWEIARASPRVRRPKSVFGVGRWAESGFARILEIGRCDHVVRFGELSCKILRPIELPLNLTDNMARERTKVQIKSCQQDDNSRPLRV